MSCYKHGETKSILHKIWCNMKGRCNYQKHIGFKDYGARGITVCEEWNNKKSGYLNFKSWALSHGYADNLSIDRIDVNGPYNPENCTWSTVAEQNANKRNTTYMTVFGKKYRVKEACEKFAVVSWDTVKSRLRQGWSDEYAILLPNVKKVRFNISKEMNSSLFTVFGDLLTLPELVNRYSVVKLSVVRRRLNRNWHILYALILPKLSKNLRGRYSNLGENIDFTKDPLESI